MGDLVWKTQSRREHFSKNLVNLLLRNIQSFTVTLIGQKWVVSTVRSLWKPAYTVPSAEFPRSVKMRNMFDIQAYCHSVEEEINMFPFKLARSDKGGYLAKYKWDFHWIMLYYQLQNEISYQAKCQLVVMKQSAVGEKSWWVCTSSFFRLVMQHSVSQRLSDGIRRVPLKTQPHDQ